MFCPDWLKPVAALLVAAALICIARPVRAAETVIGGGLAELVLDITPGTRSANPQFLASDGDLVLFSAEDGSGVKLWRSDGTASGTQALANIELGAKPVKVNGVWYLAARMPATGMELWKSDGTTVGTTLVKDIFPGSADSAISQLVALDGLLFFTAKDSTFGDKLWRSDGTETGTQIVKEIAVTGLTKVNNKLYFINNDTLWVSDGTTAGTTLLKQFTITCTTSLAADLAHLNLPNPGGVCNYPDSLIAVNDRLLLRANDGVTGNEVWSSDGTVAGTKLFKDLAAGVDSSYAIPLSATANGVIVVAESGLWNIDEQTQNATLLKAGLGLTASFGTPVTAMAGSTFFVGRETATGFGLWRTDGTVTGTIRLGTVSDVALPPILVTLNGHVYLTECGTIVFSSVSHSCRFWRSDGTANGTTPLTPTAATQGFVVADLVVVGNKLLLSADDRMSGAELWISDGTANGTAIVRDINSKPAGTAISAATDINGTLYFFRSDTRPFFTPLVELWRSDGTTAGTKRVKQFNPSLATIDPLNVAGLLYFKLGEQLWRSDGSDLGTLLLRENPGDVIQPLKSFQGSLYFLVSNSYGATSGLWRSDGTISGTRQIKAVSNNLNLVVSGNQLYFNGASEAAGYELWQSDGTSAGTGLSADLLAGPNSSSPQQFMDVNDVLYFTTNEPNSTIRLWKKTANDPTPQLIKEIAFASGYHYLDVATATTAAAFFTISNDGVGQRLWSSLGRAEETQALATVYTDVFPDFSANLPVQLMPIADRLYFWAEHPVRRGTVMSSDGTLTGTVAISGSQNISAPTSLARLNNALLFIASDEQGRRTAWLHDGTNTLALSLPLLTFGATSEQVGRENAHFTVAGNRLYFVADDGSTGPELWSIPFSTTAVLDLQVPLMVGAPPSTTVSVPIDFVNRGFAQQISLTLAITLPAELGYLGNSANLTPTVTGGSLVWPLGDLAPLHDGGLSIQLAVPAAELGSTFPLSVTLASADPSLPPQTATINVVVAHQVFLPSAPR